MRRPRPGVARPYLRSPLGAAGAVTLWAALACGTTDGPLLHARDASAPQPPSETMPLDAAGGDRDSAPPATPRDTRVQPGMRLHYQVAGDPSVDASAQVVVVDLFDIGAAEIAALRGASRVVIAYLSAGSFEPWRPDAERFPDRAVGSRLAAYPNESWLDIRSQSVRDLMRARLELARDKGFDGVYPGALNGYRSESGFPLTADDQLDFDRSLAAQARGLGLTPGLSDFALARELADDFDWAIAIGCLSDASCEALRPLIDQRKAVFDLEVEGDLIDLCARAKQLGIVTILKHPAFDAWTRTCP